MVPMEEEQRTKTRQGRTKEEGKGMDEGGSTFVRTHVPFKENAATWTWTWAIFSPTLLQFAFSFLGLTQL